MIKKEFTLKINQLDEHDILNIPVIQYIFDNETGYKFLLTGSVHGDEPTSTAALWYLNEEITRITNAKIITIIPCVNILAARANNRLIPIEETDLNRVFPGRIDGNLGERIAAQLAILLAEHDVLIDIHTAGWCTPFILIDTIRDNNFFNKIANWVINADLPVIKEMDSSQAELQGLDKSWSALAVNQNKPSITMELSGLKKLEPKSAKIGAKALITLLNCYNHKNTSSQIDLPHRIEIYSNTSGYFEFFPNPGDQIKEKEILGNIRNIKGEIIEEIISNTNGLLLAAQPISSVFVGSWLITISTL